MCENDFLLTYNPECLERHSDSSDFDDNEPSKSGRNQHSVLRRKLFRHIDMVNYEGMMRNKRYKNGFGEPKCVYENHAIHPRQCTCNECILPEKMNQTSFKKTKVKYCHDDDDKRSLHRTPSRLSIVRSKIMPCLSNIFGRSNHSKRDDSIKNKHLIVNSTKDNCCQVYCLNCNHRPLKKFNKKRNYIVQSIYSTEDELNNTPDSGINVDSAAEKESIDYNVNYEFSPSSIAANIQTAKRKFKKIVEKEFRKAYLKRHSLKRTQEQQYPSKPNFQIFSTPKMSNIDHIQSDMKDISSFGCNVMPSNSSVFWEYLVERINKKYQTNNRGGLIRSCHCTNATKCPNAGRDPLLHDGTGSQLDYKTNEQATQGSEPCSSCKGTPINSQTPTVSHPNTQMVSPAGLKDLPSPGKPCLTRPKPETAPATGKKDGPKVQCKCHTGPASPLGGTPKGSPGGSPRGSPKGSPGGSPGGPKPGGSPGLPRPGGESDSNKRPCQEPHDQIKDTLEKRYNGEILCIHNPPCILINGCLNLPPVKGQFSPSAWPVAQVASFHCGFPKSNTPKQHQEQGCQYQPPNSTGFQTYPVENAKSEKMTQSICNHDPPCEVVRCCYKPEFDPKLENSCVHVPMCQKLPGCILNERDESSKCEHQPRCAEMPVCKRPQRKYIVLTAKDDMSTQVKPNTKLDCKHVPPCIMIPKCLGKLMCDGYVPYDAIPDCAHQPPCEMIPACCRKAAKMVSSSCQYPASCRIV